MSERILKALMQLFAIIAKVEINEQTNEISSDEDSRKVVSLFLKQELNQERVKEKISRVIPLRIPLPNFPIFCKTN